MTSYKKRSPITMSPGELIEYDETRRVMAESRRREREYDQMLARNARRGIYLHPDDPEDPWSEVHLSPCPEGCRKHGVR